MARRGIGVGARLGKALRALPLALSGSGVAGSPGAAPEDFPAPDALPEPVEWGSASFDYPGLPEYVPYSKVLSVAVNGNVPFFSEADFADGGAACPGVLGVDDLWRSRGAFLVVDRTTAKIDPGEKRPSNAGLPTPTGWRDTEYEQMKVKRLYDHSHVAGWALAKQHFKDEGNVITATTALNRSGMKPYENYVLRHVRELCASGGDERVLYRVTPVFEGDDLVARGLLVEAASLPDRGASLLACAWCYNVKDGVEIDYATGGSRYVGEPEQPAAFGGGLEKAALTAGAGVAGGVFGRMLAALSGSGRARDATAGGPYVVVPATAEFHRPGCTLAPTPGALTSADRGALIETGYRPCEACRP